MPADLAAALLAGLVAWPLYGDALDLIYQGTDDNSESGKKQSKDKQGKGEKREHSSSSDTQDDFPHGSACMSMSSIMCGKQRTACAVVSVQQPIVGVSEAVLFAACLCT